LESGEAPAMIGFFKSSPKYFVVKSIMISLNFYENTGGLNPPIFNY
jgi:hypothetical protein